MELVFLQQGETVMTIAIGTENVFVDYPNGPMWTGNGPRQSTKAIKFKYPFTCKPQVVAAISLLDASNQANTRVSVECQAVTTNGFTAVVKTWADTKLAAVSIAWTAYV
jgi:hypothetical protein